MSEDSRICSQREFDGFGSEKLKKCASRSASCSVVPITVLPTIRERRYQVAVLRPWIAANLPARFRRLSGFGRT
ncbi:MAG: hypothetical protein MI755_16545 [Sphingomonadales bacterium]|nr:hypothetical protein [Sphingomonadales bacterium]